MKYVGAVLKSSKVFAQKEIIMLIKVLVANIATYNTVLFTPKTIISVWAQPSVRFD